MTLANHDLTLSRQRLSGVFLQSGFRVERIDMADTAAHEQRDHALGARREVRLLGCEWVEAHWLGIASGVVGSGSQETILVQQMRQCQAADTAAGFKQKIASGPKLFHI